MLNYILSRTLFRSCRFSALRCVLTLKCYCCPILLCENGVATLHSCTQRKRYRTCVLLNVAAHNVSIRNVKVSKRECHITYGVTKHTASQNVKCTLCTVIVTKPFVTVYILWRCTLCDVYVLKTLRFGTLMLCAATFCNITSCDVLRLCCCTLCSNIVRTHYQIKEELIKLNCEDAFVYLRTLLLAIYLVDGSQYAALPDALNPPENRAVHLENSLFNFRFRFVIICQQFASKFS